MKKHYLIIVTCLIMCGLMMTVQFTHALNQRIVALPTPQRSAPVVTGQAIVWGNTQANLHRIPAVTTSNVAQIAMGGHHALALLNTGKVVGWGTNLQGELTIPLNLSDVIQLSVGITHSVALKNNGNVVMWGASTSNVLSPTVTLPTNVVQIAAGDRHTVLLRSDGTVLVTGGQAIQRTIPTALVGKTVVAVAAGSDVSLALTNSGDLYAWGKSMTIPSSVTSDVVRIFAQGGVYAALRSDNQLLIWGDVATLTLDSTATAISSATSGCPCVLVPNMSAMRTIEVAKWGVGIVRRTGQLMPMAYSGYNVPLTIPIRVVQLGTHPSHSAGVALQSIETLSNASTPTPTVQPLTMRLPNEINPPGKVQVWGGPSLIRTVPISATNAVIQVVAGAHHIVALRSDSKVVAWGENTYGQTNVPSDLLVARDVTSPLRVVMLAAGVNHTLALRANGSVVAWGNDDYGQVTATSTWANVAQITAGARHSMALLRDGSIIGVGDNSYGQLTTPLLRSVVKIAAGGWHSVALMSDGSVVAWGRNQYGQTQIPATIRGIDIVAMNGNTVVLQPNGQVVVVGMNTSGQTTSPDAIFQRIGAGSYHVMGVTSTAQLMAWGLNGDGQTTVPNNLLTPFQVTGGIDFGVALSVDVASSDTPTITPSIFPTSRNPMLPTYGALASFNSATIWELGDIPAVSDTDINSIAVTSDTIGVLHSDNTVTLNQSASITPQTLPDNAKTSVQQLGLGSGFGAVLKRNHTLVVWGNAAPVVPAFFRQHVVEIAVNGSHLMVLTADGQAWSNQFTLGSLSLVKHIAAGPTYAVVLFANGKVAVWANDNSEGLLAVPATATGVSEIAAGQYHILALRSDGRVVAWGAEQTDVGQSDVPFSAQTSVVAIAAGNRMSVALRADNSIVAWGNVPSNTTSTLATIAANKNAVAIVAGADKIGVITDGSALTAGTPTKTRIPTQTPMVFATSTARPSGNELIANQIGWFTMKDLTVLQQFIGTAGPYKCATPRMCPQSDPNGVIKRGIDFAPTRSDELISNTSVNLTGNSFTVSYWLRRDSSQTADTVVSIGKVATVRQYLTMGFDSENRVYCSFFGDDLRSVTWYTDTNWHHYACTFDKTTLMRQLFRDGILIAQDVVGGAFSPPASPIILGQRYDSMPGLSGSLDEFILYNRVLTNSELQAYTALPATNRIADASFDDGVIQGSSPNRSQLVCVNSFICPAITDQTHDDAALQFTGSELVQFSDSTVALNKGFTIAYWAKRGATASITKVIVTQGVGINNITMGFNATENAFCRENATEVVATSPSDTDWHHYACSFDSTTNTLTLYVDGQSPVSAIGTPYTGAGVLSIGRGTKAATSTVTGFTGWLDDVMIYNKALLQTTIGVMYNSTTPPSPIATAVLTPNLTRSATATTTFTVLPSATRTATMNPSKTRLAMSRTMTMPPFKTYTATRTATRTMTLTSTVYASETKAATSTPLMGAATLTRTPLIITRTILAKRSPTWGIQTLTATYRSQAATNVAATSTRAVALTATSVASTRIAGTLTAYPLPPTATVWGTAYPTP
jgi:alpha-tubulin suppressor-like RCC1 family protein